MAKVTAYHRPESMADALALLGDAPRRVVLAGGTIVNADRGAEPIEVVDLQALGLSGITERDDRLAVGAMTTLQDVAGDERVPGVLRTLARRELPSTLRVSGTIGGLVASRDPESELLAGLLAYEAAVGIEADGGAATRPLGDVLEEGVGAGIITSITLETGGVAAAARTGRTPADVGIVAAVGRRAPDGAVRLAMSGVADTPVVVTDVDALAPPGDFRGSTAYRRHLAGVLAARVLEELA